MILLPTWWLPIDGAGRILPLKRTVWTMRDTNNVEMTYVLR